MKKVFVFILGFFMVGGTLMTPLVFAQTQVVAPAPVMEKEHGKHERHPEIHKAMRKLKAAKEDLEKADHDFGGHRVKAIQAVDQALEELRLALESDKK